MKATDRQLRARKMNSRKYRLTGALGTLLEIENNSTELSPEIKVRAHKARRHIEKMLTEWPKKIKDN